MLLVYNDTSEIGKFFPHFINSNFCSELCETWVPFPLPALYWVIFLLCIPSNLCRSHCFIFLNLETYNYLCLWCSLISEMSDLCFTVAMVPSKLPHPHSFTLLLTIWQVLCKYLQCTFFKRKSQFCLPASHTLLPFIGGPVEAYKRNGSMLGKELCAWVFFEVFWRLVIGMFGKIDSHCL